LGLPGIDHGRIPIEGTEDENHRRSDKHRQSKTTREDIAGSASMLERGIRQKVESENSGACRNHESTERNQQMKSGFKPCCHGSSDIPAFKFQATTYLSFESGTVQNRTLSLCSIRFTIRELSWRRR
jgi:hypothetical protein